MAPGSQEYRPNRQQMAVGRAVRAGTAGGVGGWLVSETLTRSGLGALAYSGVRELVELGSNTVLGSLDGDMIALGHATVAAGVDWVIGDHVQMVVMGAMTERPEGVSLEAAIVVPWLLRLMADNLGALVVINAMAYLANQLIN